MNTALQRVALRSQALYFPHPAPGDAALAPHTAAAVAQLAAFGFTLTEEALRRFNALSPEDQDETLRLVTEIFRADANWTPLVRDWLRPTGQTQEDMLYAYFCNIIDRAEPGSIPGTRLSCGCLIPDGLFDLSRYTGCPLCGRPMEVHTGVNFGAECKLRPLGVFTDEMAQKLMLGLLELNTPLDASQASTLRLLLEVYPVPEGAEVKMKETMVLALDALFAAGRPEQAAKLMRAPADMLRFLWSQKTGLTRIIRPRTLLSMSQRNLRHICPLYDTHLNIADKREPLRLYYPRGYGRMMAAVLAAMEMPVEAMCANMHPHRQMWVHMIRALRLNEHARRRGMERLAELLDRFYRGDYPVPQGVVNAAVSDADFSRASDLLKKRPGAFARQLFNLMLGAQVANGNYDVVLSAFKEAAKDLTPRLLFSLSNNAEAYFSNPDSAKSVMVATGLHHTIEPNPKLRQVDETARRGMTRDVEAVALDALCRQYARLPHTKLKKIYIAPELREIPLPVGDRSTLVSQLGAVLPGMRLPVEGDKVRLFLHWGLGMPAQYLDLDLTALIAYPDRGVECAFHNLSPTGAQHSGDIREIPDEVGTAEYIELDLPALEADGATYVAFTAQCYTTGSIPEGTMFGWMSAASPMTVNEKTGVAYDPATVQQLITMPANPGWRSICFGLLDVKARQVVVLDVPGMEQVGSELTTQYALDVLEKLRQKLTIGQALELYAGAQGLEMVSEPADDVLNFTSASLADIPELLKLLLPS